MTTADVAALPSPCLLLDRVALMRNAARLHAHVARIGTSLRPHLKTCKSLDVARAIVPEGCEVCVSTLSELEYFARGGYRNLLYAVGIVAAKVPRIAGVVRDGAHVAVVLDDAEMVRDIDVAARAAGVTLDCLVELDVDGYRAGAALGGRGLMEIGLAVAAADRLQFRGLMSYPGRTYGVTHAEAGEVMEQHVRALERARELLQPLSVTPLLLSTGSTPGTFAATDLSGVSETRVGVYMFMDLAQVNLGYP